MTRLAVIVAALSALALSACGGSADQPAGSVAGSAGQESSDYIVPSHDRISDDDSPSAAQYPSGEENDEVSASGAASQSTEITSHSASEMEGRLGIDYACNLLRV